MKFVYEDEFDVKPGKARDLRQWLVTHDDKLRLACPKGVSYLGAFSLVYTTEAETGDVRIGWGMETRSAIDALEAAASEPGLLGQLLDELHEFADGRSRWQHGGQILLASMV
jgi:hypothetical protein